jgi:hypothetical protein
LLPTILSSYLLIILKGNNKIDSISEKERWMAKPSRRKGKSKSQMSGYRRISKSAIGQQNMNKKHQKIKLRNKRIIFL